jgi:hypothetical protein
MRTLQEIIKLLQDRQPKVIATACGLHPQTVWRIKTGQASSPSFDTISRLNAYFDDQMTQK